MTRRDEADVFARRNVCERIDGHQCNAPATLAVSVTMDYDHSPTCAAKGRCLGHPVCETHGAELRSEGVALRLRSYPRLVSA